MATGRGVLAVMMACSGWILSGTGPLEAQTAAGGAFAACGADIMNGLAGVWKAPQYKMVRSSAAGAQVFGPNAFDLRDVDLTLEPSGEGLLKISTSVLDQKGKMWAPTLVEARVVVGPGKTSAAGRCEPAVTVTSAEERYLDETKYQSPITGARVMLVAGPAANQMDLRFETPKGAGSFWSTLTRQTKRPAAKSTTN